MAKFFTSPKDLARWVKEANSSHGEAVEKIIMAIGSNKNEQDIYETTKRIFANNNIDEASETLFNLLANYNITEKNIKVAEDKYDVLVASKELLNKKVITADEQKKMIKEAQIMRQPGQYDMPLRVCPKLPYSVGKRLISTYNCRHYCLDSITFDDDPLRVYCAEALWRKHVMDKFSRDWQDAKTGELVGGYINSRFYVFPDAGTPGNKDVPRDGGNKMALNPWERSRMPRKHEWSVERRLQEQREPNSTKSITLADAITSSKNMIKLASSDIKTESQDNTIEKIFSESIDAYNSGMKMEDAALMLSEKYKKPVENIVAIQTVALKKMSSHQADVYKTSLKKTAADRQNFIQLQQDITDKNGVRLSHGTLLQPTPSTTQNLFNNPALDNNNYETWRYFDNNEKELGTVQLNKEQIASITQEWNQIQQGWEDVSGEETNQKDLLMGQNPLPGKTAPTTETQTTESTQEQQV